MSFIEQEGPEVNEKYVSNIDILNRRRAEYAEKHKITKEEKTNEYEQL